MIQRYESTFSVSEKVEGRVDFPLSINMLPYTTKSQSKNVDKSKYMYDLSSVVVHKGKLDAGHYFAFCRQGDQVCYHAFIYSMSVSSSLYTDISSLQKWMLFDDDKVTAAKEADVLNVDAYLLFYGLRSLPGV